MCIQIKYVLSLTDVRRVAILVKAHTFKYVLSLTGEKVSYSSVSHAVVRPLCNDVNVAIVVVADECRQKHARNWIRRNARFHVLQLLSSRSSYNN